MSPITEEQYRDGLDSLQADGGGLPVMAVGTAMLVDRLEAGARREWQASPVGTGTPDNNPTQQRDE